MKRLLAILTVLALATGLGASVALAQDNGDVTPEDVEAALADLTRSEIEAMGYVVEDVCVTAELAGAPAELGAMGFHAVNESLIDDSLDPLEPEAFVLDADDNVLAVEYIAEPNSGLSVLGQELVHVEAIGHDALHLWFLDNPSGQFADFNPNAGCPEVTAPPTTGTGGDLGSGSGLAGAGLLALLAAVAGAGLLAGGLALRTRLR